VPRMMGSASTLHPSYISFPGMFIFGNRLKAVSQVLTLAAYAPAQAVVMLAILGGRRMGLLVPGPCQARRD